MIKREKSKNKTLKSTIKKDQGVLHKREWEAQRSVNSKTQSGGMKSQLIIGSIFISYYWGIRLFNLLGY